MKIKSIKQLKNLTGKRVFLRCDFNLPLEKGRIKEDYRLRRGLQTINWLLEKGAKLIIATHLGDPKGKDKSLSTKIIATHLEKLLQSSCFLNNKKFCHNFKVNFLAQYLNPKVKEKILAAQPGEMFFLENLRFEPGEKANDSVFAKQLASLADVYVNDAFAVCHRAQASVSAIKKFLPAYAGLLLEQEVINLNKVLNPKKPLISVIGGVKISTKAPLIEKLYKKSAKILIGGALANNFLKGSGAEIGNLVWEEASLKFAKKFFSAKKKDKKIILPIDAVIGDLKDKKVLARVKTIKQLSKKDCILDIGPETITAFSTIIKQAKTIVWNGPLGAFENEKFKHGTLALARIIAARSGAAAFTVIGGGETVEALKMSQMSEYVNWVSTGGGAMLSYLGGEKMPGLTGLIIK